MGKNQAYKSMQRARVGTSGSAAPEDIEDGMVDSSFHSPEWHAARLASLKTSHTITWEEFKKKQKEDELRRGEMEADTDKMMKEYRAQLDAERACKLAQGRNYTSSKKEQRRDRIYKKDKDLKKHSSKKRKRSRRSSESSSSSSSSSLSSDEDDRDAKRSMSKSKRSKKGKKRKSRSRHSSSDSDETGGPVPLSRFFGSVKS